MSVTLLHIETATTACSVALSKNGVLVDHEDLLGDGYVHGERLTLLIQSLLERTGTTMAALNAISVSAGPGSYTGLRIGISTVKGLCFALGVPLIAVNTLDALVSMARTKYPEATICAMLDARRMEVYSLINSATNQVVKPVSADVLDESSYASFEPFVCVGDGAPKMQEFWNARSITWDNSIHCSAAGQVNLAYEKFLNQAFEDVAYFEPNYVKEFYTPAKSK